MTNNSDLALAKAMRPNIPSLEESIRDSARRSDELYIALNNKYPNCFKKSFIDECQQRIAKNE